MLTRILLCAVACLLVSCSKGGGGVAEVIPIEAPEKIFVPHGGDTQVTSADTPLLNDNGQSSALSQSLPEDHSGESLFHTPDDDLSLPTVDEVPDGTF
ncbi:MAG: hypothetical protein ACSHX0_00850 [Akkermansiaceae bacterium]